jgi:uncharacterized repeat protein (TIGR01451 family)
MGASLQLRQARSAVVRVLAPQPQSDMDGVQLQVQTGPGMQLLKLRPNRTLGVLATRLRGKAIAYQGELANVPGSWVAVTRIGPRWTGIWFDGAHYFGIDDARSLADISREAARGPPDRHLVFRLADLATDASFEGDIRMPTAEVMARRVEAELSQPSLMEAITMAAAVLPTKRLAVALIADPELASQDGPQTETNMLARLNIVDGIFASQVGVHLQSGSVTILSGTQPFDTTDPSSLLTELSTYRSGSQLQRASGLSHLFTGRDLDGRTVGIAYISGLCSNSFSASLSQARDTVQFDALIAAHEIGHVFGAPHDGEASSACESTPTTFLMAPQLNNSSTFSQCSLDQIAPVVARASCLAPYDSADGTIDAPTEVQVALNVPTDITVVAHSVGTATLNSATLRISVPLSVALQSASGTMASCSVVAQTADCALGDLAPGTAQSVTFRVLAQTVGTPTAQLRIMASNDGLTANDTRSLTLRVSQGADLALSGTIDRSSVAVGENVSAVLTLQNRGPADVTDARIVVTVPSGLTLLQQTGENVSCAVVTAGLTCGPQPLAAGAAMRATLALRADTTGSLVISSQASASAPELLAADNQLQQTVTATAVPAPASPSSPNGGGGGGTLSGMTLAALSALAARTARRRQRVAAAK